MKSHDQVEDPLPVAAGDRQHDRGDQREQVIGSAPPVIRHPSFLPKFPAPVKIATIRYYGSASSHPLAGGGLKKGRKPVVVWSA